MAGKCGFEQDLGNGLKAGVIGTALGAIGWLVWGAAKGKSEKRIERWRDDDRRPRRDGRRR